MKNKKNEPRERHHDHDRHHPHERIMFSECAHLLEAALRVKHLNASAVGLGHAVRRRLVEVQVAAARSLGHLCQLLARRYPQALGRRR